MQTKSIKTFVKKACSHESSAVLTLLAVCLLLGVFIVRDYGESWDEHVAYLYGDYAIHAYQYFFHP